MYTVIEDELVFPLNLKALVRVIFVFGALVSWLDSMTTWAVLRQTGIGKEGNFLVTLPMQHLGIGPTCAARFLLGVLAFWSFARHVVGRHNVVTKRQSEAYYRREERCLEPETLPLWRRPLRFMNVHSAAIEIAFALMITSAVVGNNLRALLTLSKMS